MELSETSVASVQQRADWLMRLTALIENVDQLGQETGWATRRIETDITESDGTYQAPALLLQKETCRILLEPVASSAPGVAGVVDLYLMPEYDDIASLYFVDGAWRIQYQPPNGLPAADSNGDAEFSRQALESVLNEMLRHAA